MPFFHYLQNNSFGIFKGPKSVFVEADNYVDANTIAQANGIYFGGVSPDGESDCPCCGDRWHEQTEYDEGTEVPQYGDRFISVAATTANDKNGIKVITKENKDD